jgi:acyl-CoA thioesterase-2
VDRSRDGRSFTTRRVVAIQHGQQIFNLAASFHVAETGAEHQAPMPQADAPETYREATQLRAENAALMPDGQSAFYNFIPVEWRFVDLPIPAADDPHPARQRAWFRLRQPLGDDVRMHQAALAYCSDVALIGASIRPHRRSHATRPQTASLDHAMWFHRPADANQWHLYEMESPSASGARGFNLGAIYSQAGALVANAAQEDLIRFPPEGSAGA